MSRPTSVWFRFRSSEVDRISFRSTTCKAREPRELLTELLPSLNDPSSSPTRNSMRTTSINRSSKSLTTTLSTQSLLTPSIFTATPLPSLSFPPITISAIVCTWWPKRIMARLTLTALSLSRQACQISAESTLFSLLESILKLSRRQISSSALEDTMMTTLSAVVFFREY